MTKSQYPSEDSTRELHYAAFRISNFINADVLLSDMSFDEIEDLKVYEYRMVHNQEFADTVRVYLSLFAQPATFH